MQEQLLIPKQIVQLLEMTEKVLMLMKQVEGISPLSSDMQKPFNTILTRLTQALAMAFDYYNNHKGKINSNQR